MSTSEEKAQAQAAEAAQGESLLDQIVQVTPQTEPDHAKDLVSALVDEFTKGTMVYDKDVTRTLTNGIAEIDKTISKQLAAIMHAPEFQQMEGTWRGLHHLVMNSETGTELKIKMLNVSKRALFKDLDRAIEFDQSQIFKKLYEK